MSGSEDQGEKLAEPCMNGWVLKEGKRLKSRSRRYLSLKGSLLAHHVKEQSAPTWEIDLADVRISVGERSHEFVVSAAGRSVSFFAESNSDYMKWVAALKHASSMLEDFYTIGTQIGQGSYGEVFIGVDKITKESRAIKIIKKNPNNRKQKKFIERERAIMTTVKHPHIVQTMDIFEGPTKLAIVSEYMKGGELFDLIISSQFFTEDVRSLSNHLNALGFGIFLRHSLLFALTTLFVFLRFHYEMIWHLAAQKARLIMKQILEGVAYLHSRNIVHRDIKPENILCVDQNWPLVVKLTDFGLSNFLRNDDTEDDSMLLSHVGTSYYIAPEIMGKLGYGPAVDIWACGVVLYIMLCGRFPFWGKTDIEYMQSLNAGPSLIGEGWDEVSPKGKRYLRDLLQLDPKRRPSAKQALNHPWICGEGPSLDRRLSSINGITEIASIKSKTSAGNTPIKVNPEIEDMQDGHSDSVIQAAKKLAMNDD